MMFQTVRPQGRPPSPAKADLLYGVKAIATFLGITRPQAQYRIEEGIIPTFRIGGTICARRSDLQEWLAGLAAAAAAAREEARRGKEAA